MIKKNKWKLLFSSIVTLFPIVFGLIFWDKLPAEMTTHWGFDGNADGWMNKASTVFLLPVILLAIHWLCVLVSLKLPGGEDQHPKLMGIVLWIIPIVSLFAHGSVYMVAFGIKVQPLYLTNLLIGLLFIVLGNYMPKAKRNPAMGIKVKWALENEENWYATHRFGGKVYVIGGFLLLVGIFLPIPAGLWVSGGILLALILIPTVYSYQYYKKQVKAGTYTANPVVIPNSKVAKRITLVMVPLILALVAVLMFSGNVEVSYQETSFTVDSSFWSALTVEYESITNIEYRGEGVPGTRTNGIGSARLLAGLFQNEEFGLYTRYTYTGSDPCVVLHVGDKILVIGSTDAAATKAIYETIQAKIG